MWTRPVSSLSRRCTSSRASAAGESRWSCALQATIGSAPAKLRCDKFEDAVYRVGVVVHAQLIRDGQEQGVGCSDGLVRGELFDQHLGFRGVRAAKNGARVGVDVADLVLVASVTSEIDPVAIVDERENAATHRHARLTLVPGLFPCLPVGFDLLALLNVQRFAALVVLESRALEVHSQLRGPL